MDINTLTAIFGVVGFVIGVLSSLLVAEFRFVRRHEYERDQDRYRQDRLERDAKLDKRLENIERLLERLNNARAVEMEA